MSKEALAEYSGVFRDMLEVADNDEVAEVPLAESSEVLEMFLPFCLDKNTPRFVWAGLEKWSVIKALDKYDVSLAFQCSPCRESS